MEMKPKTITALGLFIVMLFFCLSTPGVKKEKKWNETEFGAFRIEKFWEENIGGYNCTYTIVTYRNSTSKTFNQIEIKATVIDKNDDILNTNTRSFFGYEQIVSPGFEDTVKIPVETEPGKAASVKVKLRGL